MENGMSQSHPTAFASKSAADRFLISADSADEHVRFGFWFLARPKMKISGPPLYGTALLFPQSQIIIVGVVRIRLFPIALAKICGTAGTLFTFLPVFGVEEQVAFVAYGNILHAEKLAALGYTNIVEFGGIID